MIAHWRQILAVTINDSLSQREGFEKKQTCGMLVAHRYALFLSFLDVEIKSIFHMNYLARPKKSI